MSDATSHPGEMTTNRDMKALLAHSEFVRGLARSLVGETEADDLAVRMASED